MRVYTYTHHTLTEPAYITNIKHASSQIPRHLFHDGLLNVMFGTLLILIKGSMKMRAASGCHDPIKATGKCLEVCVYNVCVREREREAYEKKENPNHNHMQRSSM